MLSKEDQDYVSLNDRQKLVYTDATLLEVARLGSVLPIAPPRQCSEAVKVGPWTIPKGGNVQMNLYSLHRNKEHWEDPECFRPERFISNGVVVNVSTWCSRNYVMKTAIFRMSGFSLSPMARENVLVKVWPRIQCFSCLQMF